MNPHTTGSALVAMKAEDSPRYPEIAPPNTTQEDHNEL